jgi:hypothetical protein
MDQIRRMDRREFTVEGVLAALSGVVITISGCGGGGGGYSSPSSPSTPAPTPASSSDKTGSISDNHGHEAIITGAQLTAASTVQLDIRGGADHTHAVTLNADAIQNIQAGRAVATDSTTTSSTTMSSHQHTVTFNSTSAEPPIRY